MRTIKRTPNELLVGDQLVDRRGIGEPRTITRITRVNRGVIRAQLDEDPAEIVINHLVDCVDTGETP
jgi:hypothetical protein